MTDRLQFLTGDDALGSDEALRNGDVSHAWSIWSSAVEGALADAYRFYVFMWSLFCADLQVLVEMLCLEISILYKKTLDTTRLRLEEVLSWCKEHETRNEVLLT